MNNIFLYGISYKTAPLEIREKYTFTKNQHVEMLKILAKYFNQVILLSTCNRTEVYFETELSLMNSISIIRNEFEIPLEETKYFYFLEGKSFIRHIFRVASSLDSQIIGENEILHQVKSAYFISKELNLTAKDFNLIFQKAIEIGKLIRSITRISQGSISVAKVALNMAGNIENRKILIIGTGNVSEAVVKNLKYKNVKVVIVSNRNYQKAEELARFISGKAVGFELLKEELKDTDIIISATSAPHFVLKKEDFSLIKNRDLIIFDLACPRDVDPEIKNIEGIKYYDLDDIKILIDENYRKRLQEAKKAEKIIEEEVNFFYNNLWKTQNLKKLELEPVPVI